MENLFALADSNADDELTAEELVNCREHPRFGGSAAFNHAQDWIKRLLETLERIAPEKLKTDEREKATKPKKRKKAERASVEKSEL